MRERDFGGRERINKKLKDIVVLSQRAYCSVLLTCNMRTGRRKLVRFRLPYLSITPDARKIAAKTWESTILKKTDEYFFFENEMIFAGIEFAKSISN